MHHQLRLEQHSVVVIDLGNVDERHHLEVRLALHAHLCPLERGVEREVVGDDVVQPAVLDPLEAVDLAPRCCRVEVPPRGYEQASRDVLEIRCFFRCGVDAEERRRDFDRHSREVCERPRVAVSDLELWVPGRNVDRHRASDRVSEEDHVFGLHAQLLHHVLEDRPGVQCRALLGRHAYQAQQLPHQLVVPDLRELRPAYPSVVEHDEVEALTGVGTRECLVVQLEGLCVPVEPYNDGIAEGSARSAPEHGIQRHAVGRHQLQRRPTRRVQPRPRHLPVHEVLLRGVEEPLGVEAADRALVVEHRARDDRKREEEVDEACEEAVEERRPEEHQLVPAKHVEQRVFWPVDEAEKEGKPAPNVQRRPQGVHELV
mmetsp:Transcript_24982/g.59614  ORF Transcript_24982/g.59614 Transcript_24982/m.59614 type:complete len:372 (+) Transcript_24982:481-1596(+)